MFDERLDFMQYLTDRAGQILNRYWRSNQSSARKKEDGSVITDADLRVSDLVKDEISRRFPKYGLLTEESKDSPDRLNKEGVFVVDELDGTHEFSEGKEEFCFMVAYVENGIPKIGVIYEPAKKRMLFAEKNSGTFVKQNGSAERLSGLRHGVNLENALIGHSRNYKGERFERLYKSLKIPTENQRISGALGTRILETALQKIHIIPCYHKTAEWDIAAGDIILQEQGIPVVDFRGNSLAYNKPIPRMEKGVLVVHPDIKEATLENLANLDVGGDLKWPIL